MNKNPPLKMLEDGVAIVAPFPALFLYASETLCISDIHLGYEEGVAAELGLTLPTSQLDDVTTTLGQLVERCAPRHLLINGDLKHVFSESGPQEWAEVPAFIDYALERFDDITLVRGNHDTMLGPLYKYRDRVAVVDDIVIDDILFSHGHKKIKQRDGRLLVIGHEHPAIVLGDTVGARAKMPAFLHNLGERLVVLPAFSPLAGGTEINLADVDDLLSPILRETGIDDIIAYGIDQEAGLLELPALKQWRHRSLQL